MFGFGSSIFSSASTLVSSAVQELKEWLCLTCQTQRALGATHPKGVSSVKSQIPAKQKKDLISSAEPEKKDVTQSKPSVTPQPTRTEAANKQEDQKQPSPVPSPKRMQEPQKTPGLNKSPAQTRQSERKQSNAAAATQQESGGFFGFGGGKTQPDAAKPAESGTGKMFGFGSSIFSSASTLITSAVQDQPKTTPPVSPKMSAAKDIRSPAAHKKEQQTKPEQLQETKTPPSAKEWLCLTCQTQRAVGATQLPGVASVKSQIPAKPQKKDIISPAEPEKKDSTQKNFPLTPQPATVEAASKPEEKKQPSPVPPQKHPEEPQKTPGPNKSPDQTRQTERKQSNAAAATRRESGGFFGFGGDKTQPEATKPAETSPRYSTSFSQDVRSKRHQIPCCQKKEQQTKPEQPQETKTPPSVKEWLCLTCQTQRAVGATQPQGANPVNSQIPATPQKKDIISPAEPKKDSTQKKPSETAKPATTETANKPKDHKQPSPVPSPKRTQDPQKTPGPNKSPQQTRQTERKQSISTAATQQESGGVFGFGGGKAQPDAAKPAESGTGKMFGFGSSIFSSASTLITSAVQDTPKTTPPVSPKMSAAKETKSPAAQKKEQQTKPEQPQETKTPPSVKEWLCLTCQTQRAVREIQPPGVAPVISQIPATPQKKDIISSAEPERKDSALKKPSETAQPTTAETANKPEDQKQPSPVPSQRGRRSLRKLQVRINHHSRQGKVNVSRVFLQQQHSKSQAASLVLVVIKLNPMLQSQQTVQDTPKTTPPVSPKMSAAKEIRSPAAQKKEQQTKPEQPQETKTPPSLKEWLCLTCQTQRAVGATHPKGVSSVKSEIPAKQKKDLISSAEPEKKDVTQSKPSVTPQPTRTEAANKQEDQKQPSPVPSPKRMQEPQKTPGPNKSPAQTRQSERKQSNAAAATQQESGGFFGFGGVKTQPEATKPAESGTGKMFGFGSSIFSSASTLITSAVQDQPKTTPPVSPKMSAAKEIRSPAASKKEQQTKPEQPQETKTPPSMQRAITAAELVDPPLMKPQASPNKAPSPVAAQKDVTANTKKDTISSVKAEVQDQNKTDSPTPGVPKKEEETKASFQTVITETTTIAAPPAKEITHTVTAPTKEEKTASPSTKEISITTAPPIIETADVKPQPVEVPPVNTNIETSVQRSEDITPPCSLLTEEVLEKKEGTAETVQKPADQPIRSDEAQPPKALNEESAPPVAQSTNPEKILEQQQDKAPPSEKATEKEWLCLNCQMQRALGASEPPGLPMIKPKPSPSKEVPVTTQKKATPMSTSEEDMHKRAAPTDELVDVSTTKDTEAPDLGVVTKKVSPAAVSLPDKTSLSSTTTTDVSPGLQKPSEETSKGHPSTPQQQPPTSDTPTSISTSPLTVPGEGKVPPQQTQKAVTSPAISTTPPPILEAVKPSPQQLPQTVTSSATSVHPPAPEAGKPPPQQPPKTLTSIDTSAPPPDQVAGKPPPQQPPKTLTSIATSAPPPDQVARKPSQQHPPKVGTSPAKSAPPPVEPAKQASGGFFGFGGPKTQPKATKSAESVSGKMFGFGSSFLNSASTLITSAVQDEPKMTPPTPRKMSTTAHVSPRTTPPASPRTLPAKNTEALPQTLEKKAEKQQQKKDLSTPSPTKVSIPPGSELKDIPTLVQREKSAASAVVKEEVIQAVPKREVMSTIEAPVPIETPRRDSVQKTQVLSATPPPAQPAKQESGGFFGFGGPKTQPAAAKPAESVTGKMFGFGSSIFSSASTLITTPPSPRRMSTTVSPKITPPVSPKMPPAKDTTPPAAEKSEPPQQAKPAPSAQAKKEWLCLNCQTQRALSGQLGDSGKRPQLSPVPATKPEPTTPPIKAVPIVSTKKAQMEPTSVKLETMAKAASAEIKTEIARIPTIATVSPVTADKQPLAASTAEAIIPTMASVQKTTEKGKVVVPTTNVPKTVTVENKEEAVKVEFIETKDSKAKDSKPDIPKAKAVAGEAEASSFPVIEATAVSTSSISAEVAMAKVVPETEKIAELSAHGKIIKEVQADDHIQLTDLPTSLQQVEVQPKSQERQLVLEEQPTDSKEIADKLVDNIIDITSTPETQQISTETVVIKEQDGIKKETIKERKVSKAEEHDEDQPHILPISQEFKDNQVASETSTNDINTDTATPEKEEVKAERRRLSVKPMFESSDSELTPSPKVQRKKLAVTNLSSSSEDIKTESADYDSMDDEEFIRRQILGMGDEEKMSLSEDEKENNLADEKAILEVVLDDASVTGLSLYRKSSTENEESSARKKTLQKTDTATTQYSPERIPSSTFKKALPVMKQRQTPDEEVESITESLSKGSSSVQVSSFTPGSSPTSASSLEEDSDSSPSHRKVSGDKHHRKGKHRQSTQPLPTIEDSSEDEKIKTHGPLPSPTASSTENLRQVIVTDDTSRTSGSEYSASLESESEAKRAVQRGLEEPENKMGESQEEEVNQETSSECLQKLRSPEEVYEEMMQKKRELIMIEQEFQQSQTAIESSSSGASVTWPSLIDETCVVTMPMEETSLTEKIDMPLIFTEYSSELTLKKKKRPAPPRPSEPPKRSEVTVVTITPSGSIGFVRPMVPQDPALRKALFPIPDLKITQCSSGEEEDDSLAEEYGVGISSDITPSDDSETKDDASISPPLSETADMEPICVVCEIPEAKPIPTPISAPELTSTPSPTSPMSVPTSPATPDSSLASNATSSSSFQAQTPLSSESTPLSTPTPPTSCVTQSPPENSSPSPAPIAEEPSSGDSVSHPTPYTVIVTIPDVVWDPSKAQTTEAVQVKASAAGASPPALVGMSTPLPVVVQMPDLVSSPSQMPIEAPAVIQVSAQSPAPVVLSALPTTQVTVTPVVVSNPESAIVQKMPDLVSTTSTNSAQTPLPAVVSTKAQVQAKVVPLQAAVTSISPVIPASSQAAQVSAASTTITKKKVPPPPPPRSTSVSLPELPLVKTVQDVTPTMNTTIARGATVTGQPMQSIVVDIQPRMEEMQPESTGVPQIVTPTRNGHVVIIVPSLENMSLLGKTPRDLASTESIPAAASLPQSVISASSFSSTTSA
ncbi:Protein piccolo [Dissostichus eleginoides]|uniref:Protein piccolo n=1 Tax=Dissostichus eleginoides TaxID=100907 RepID=A0AAD9BRY7_DISEL|nr:Protein piccolo [Dissostichus eleginoides]